MEYTGLHESGGFPIFFGGFVIFALFVAVVHIVALIQCITSKFRDSNDKIVWILVLLFAPFIGSILWYTVGKPKSVV
jgi:hypothetical protein